MPHNLHDLQSLPLPDAYTLACCKVEIPFPTENPQNREDLRDGYNIPLFLSSPMNFQHPLTENNTDCHFPNQSQGYLMHPMQMYCWMQREWFLLINSS